MFNKQLYPNCLKGHDYALEVLCGSIPASIYVVGACNRFFKDIERSKTDPGCTFYFDPDKAEKYLRLVQKFNHVSGRWTSRNIEYMPWQCFIFMNVKGFISKETGEVRFRTAHVEIPRGNGKSAMASQAVLYDLALDNPVGNHIYCAATRKEQAKIVLVAAIDMAKNTKTYLKKTGVGVFKHHIEHAASNSYARAISSDSKGLDGKIGKLIVTDELHAMKRETFEVLDSGQSKRRDSLLLSITTAGYDNTGVGHSQSSYAKKVALGETEDDTFFAFVATIDEGDDYFSENTWKKANPGFGVIVDPVNFEAKAKKAKVNPQDLNGFLIKHLNVWTSSATKYFSVDKWDDLKRDISLKDFIGQKCYMGTDFSNKIDLAGYGFVFKKEDCFYVFDKTYIPDQTLKESRNDGYRRWVQSGDLIVTPGAAINYVNIGEDVFNDSQKFKVNKLLFDPWNATEFSIRMAMKRIEVAEFKMNVSNLSEPMKRLETLIRERRIFHNGSPLLKWCLGNVVAKIDHNENVFPRKEHQDNKIDPIICILMGLAGWISEEKTESVYQERGLRIL